MTDIRPPLSEAEQQTARAFFAMLSDAEMLAVMGLKHPFHPDSASRFATLLREETARRTAGSATRSHLQFEDLTVGLPLIDLQTHREMQIIGLHKEQRVAICAWSDSQRLQVEQPFLPEALELASRRGLRLIL